MVTREKIEEILRILNEIRRDDLAELVRLCETALTSYNVNGTTKTLPQADIDSLVQQFKEKRDSLVQKLQSI